MRVEVEEMRDGRRCRRVITVPGLIVRWIWWLLLVVLVAPVLLVWILAPRRSAQNLAVAPLGGTAQVGPTLAVGASGEIEEQD